MAENIQKINAERILITAFGQNSCQEDEISLKIKTILYGTHKTYKYILITGLLGKATNEKVNALTLQANAPFEGAYDARTLCHRVIVPFERNYLNNVLGGSNEPFLNKPARFTHLSEQNAVRKGNDKELLLLLIDIFNNIDSSQKAKEYLSCALKYLNDKIEENSKLENITIEYNPTLVEIYSFCSKFIERSFEGESTAVLTGTLEKIYYKQVNGIYEVVTHKVNQSGASSKEVGDIDIFKKGEYNYSIEVKDKAFNQYDLEHAIEKIISSGGNKGQFIYGVNGTFNEIEISDSINKYAQKGFMILFQDIYTYMKGIIFKIDLEDKSEFIKILLETANEINSKEELKIWIHQLVEDLKK